MVFILNPIVVYMNNDTQSLFHSRTGNGNTGRSGEGNANESVYSRISLN